MLFSTTITRPLQLLTRVLQWASAVIVMGLTSFFINRGPRGLHTIYQEVIVRYSRFLSLTDHHSATVSNRKLRPSSQSSSSFRPSFPHSCPRR